MNAYKYLKSGAIVPVTMDAIQDLVELGKQQAKRIEELEKQFDAMVMSFETRLATRGYEIQIKDQAKRIEELERRLTAYKQSCQVADTQIKALQDLVTKELSDEEIMKVLNGIEYSAAEVETSFDYEIRVARAIIKASRGEE